MSKENDPKQAEYALGLDEFETILPKICSRETSTDPKGWSKDNPLQDHCAVVSLVANKLYGGIILRASLEGTPYAKSRSHYKNRFSFGDKDFTVDQFKQGYPEGLYYEERIRKDLVSNPGTLSRYTQLTLNLAEYLEGENPLLKDDLYKRCIVHALMSPCQKMGFGAVLTRNNLVVAEAHNDTIDELAYMCNPECIRLNIKSRTESMLGACGHAEELVMKIARDNDIPLKECDLYVAGVKENGLPWIKKQPEHTCLRCSVQMYYAGLKSINVPVKDRWESLTPQEALRTAARYATQEKQIGG